METASIYLNISRSLSASLQKREYRSSNSCAKKYYRSIASCRTSRIGWATRWPHAALRRRHSKTSAPDCVTNSRSQPRIVSSTHAVASVLILMAGLLPLLIEDLSFTVYLLLFWNILQLTHILLQYCIWNYCILLSNVRSFSLIAHQLSPSTTNMQMQLPHCPKRYVLFTAYSHTIYLTSTVV